MFAYTASSGTTESALVYLQVMPNANQWANLIIIMAYAPFLHMLSLASYVVRTAAHPAHPRLTTAFDPPGLGALTLRTLLITQRAETKNKMTRWFQNMRHRHLQNQLRMTQAVRAVF